MLDYWFRCNINELAMDKEGRSTREGASSLVKYRPHIDVQGVPRKSGISVCQAVVGIRSGLKTKAKSRISFKQFRKSLSNEHLNSPFL